MERKHPVKLNGGRLQRPQRQRGIVLLVGLVILLVMTLIGVAALRGSTLEERMAANAALHNRAFQAAESAMINAMQTAKGQYDSSSQGQELSSILEGVTGSTITANLGDAELKGTATIAWLNKAGGHANSSLELFEGQAYEVSAIGRVEAGGETVAESKLAGGFVIVSPKQ